MSDSDKMVKLDVNAKKAILKYRADGWTLKDIALQLRDDFELFVSPQAVHSWLKVFAKTNSLVRRPGSQRPSKITPSVLRLVEAKMQCDDTTAVQLHELLLRSGIFISLSTVNRSRRMLGWTFHGTRYCQMIRLPNKTKRLDFAKKCLEECDDFNNVIWSDETSVQLECHKRFCFRKKNAKPRYKPKAKHPIKVHVWAAISRQGATQVTIFEGWMLHSTFKSVKNILSPLGFIPHSLEHTNSCRITIQNIPQE